MTIRPETATSAQTPKAARSHNRQVVLARVHAAGQIGRAEIARASGLSTQAVSNIIADLLADALIEECGRRANGRGLPAVQYALNPEGAYAMGIEIRPDAIFCALLDFSGRCVFEERLAQTDTDLDSITRALVALERRATRDIPFERVLGAGIVMPGPFGPTGFIGSGSELSDISAGDPPKRFAEALGLQVFVENDANAAAMAERMSGTAQGLDSYAYLYFGTGLGLGIVHQGRLVAGAFGNSGEIGHIPVPCDGAVVPLETAVSRLSVQRHLAQAGSHVASGDDLARLYTAGDPALNTWLQRAAEPLSAAIATVENMLDPQTIILGGAMPEPVLDHLINAVTLSDRSVSNRRDRARPRLVRGATGRMTATLGAAALVINQAFTPMIAVAQ